MTNIETANTPHATVTKEIAQAFGMENLPSSLVTILKGKFTIAFDAKALIENCAGTDQTRHSICKAIFIDSKKNLLVSTDGTMMGMIPFQVLEGSLEDCVIPIEALKATRKQTAKKSSRVLLTVDLDSKEVICESQKFALLDVQYPNYSQAVPSEPANKFLVSFDVEKLMAIAKAIGRTCVVLEVDAERPEGAPIRVSASQNMIKEAPMGILMPVRYK